MAIGLTACSSSHPCSTLPDAGPGCSVGTALLSCDDGTGQVTCLSNTGGCPQVPGACVSECAADEFAASCGAPPSVLPDAGVLVPNEAAPFASCHIAEATPNGYIYYCCSCD
jgi:hypothetical protein